MRIETHHVILLVALALMGVGGFFGGSGKPNPSVVPSSANNSPDFRSTAPPSGALSQELVRPESQHR